MADRKGRMILLSAYAKHHMFKYDEKPVHNLNAEQWAADNLIESYSLATCKEMLDYYFEASESPSWRDFVDNAQKIFDAKKRIEQDVQERKERLELARKWLND